MGRHLGRHRSRGFLAGDLAVHRDNRGGVGKAELRGRDGDGGAGFLSDQTDHLGEPVGDGLAVERKGLGELTVLGLQPLVQDGGQRLGVDPTQQGVEHVAAGLPMAAGPTRFRPAGRRVADALEAFRIDEGLCQKRPVSRRRTGLGPADLAAGPALGPRSGPPQVRSSLIPRCHLLNDLRAKPAPGSLSFNR